MKSIVKSTIITILITVAVLTGITAGVAMLLIPAVIGTPESPAGDDISGIEYSPVPQNRTLFITDEAGRGALIYLNFEEIVTHVYLFEESAEEQVLSLPYNIDFRMKVTEASVGRICDRIGGIDIETEEGTERYFSSSLADFSANSLNYEKMLKISQGFFEKIANIGLSSEDFMFIIEVNDTNLTYSVCYGWIDRIPEMFCNCIFH